MLVVICSNQGSLFVDSWFESMCKRIEIGHAKSLAYHSRSNHREWVARSQIFEKFRQLKIDVPQGNPFISLSRVLQPSGDLSGLSPHRIVFLHGQVYELCRG